MAILRRLEVTDEKKWKKLLKELSPKKNVQIEIEKLVSDPNFYGLVLEEEGEMIGFGSISFYHASLKGSVGVVEDIIVDSAFRSKGFGVKIFDALLEEGEKRNVNNITLTSNPERGKAREIYTSRGFILYETGFFVKKRKRL